MIINNLLQLMHRFDNHSSQLMERLQCIGNDIKDATNPVFLLLCVDNIYHKSGTALLC